METTVLEAKNRLSDLLRKAETGQEVIVRRGARGPRFRTVPLAPAAKRTLAQDPRCKGKIAYKDEDVWASEWKEEE